MNERGKEVGGGGGAGRAIPSVWRAQSFAAACRDEHIIMIVDARANASVSAKHPVWFAPRAATTR